MTIDIRADEREDSGAPPGEPTVDMRRMRLRKATINLASALNRGDGIEGAWGELQAAMSGALPRIGNRLIEEEDLAALWNAQLPEPTLGLRADGAALLYDSKIHWLSGEPGSGKTWLALLWTLEQVRAGKTVLYLDMESDATTIASRLRAIGITIEELARVSYLRVRWDLTQLPQIIEAIVDRIETRDPSLVVLDGMAATLAALGKDENSNSDVSAFTAAVLRPISEAGPAVVVVDHLAKPQGDRGSSRYSRGASAKLADASGVAYLLVVEVPFSRQRPGVAKLIVGKDRNGAVGAMHECVGEIHFIPANGDLGVDVRVPEGARVKGRFIPDGWMGKLSRELESAKQMTASEMKAFVGTKSWEDPSSTARQAAALLEKHSFIKVEKVGNAKHFVFVKAFTDADVERVRDAEHGPDTNASSEEKPF